MSKDHYSILESAILGVVKEYPQARQQYIDVGLNDKRYRWDLLWYARDTGKLPKMYMGDLYKYLNDEHIDTALRRIVS